MRVRAVGRRVAREHRPGVVLGVERDRREQRPSPQEAARFLGTLPPGQRSPYVVAAVQKKLDSLKD